MLPEEFRVYGVLVEGSRWAPWGVRAVPKLRKTGMLLVSSQSIELRSKPTPPWAVLAVWTAVALAFGAIVAALAGQEASAGLQDGSDVGFRFAYGGVGACLIIVPVLMYICLCGWVRHRTSLTADPRTLEAIYHWGKATLCFELDDGRWLSVRPVDLGLADTDQFLEILRTCYGERLTMQE